MNNHFTLILLVSFVMYTPTQVYAKIVMQPSRVKFINEHEDLKKEKAGEVRFKSFNRFQKVLSRKDCAKAPFALEGKGTYAALIPFAEYLEKADFKVAPNKDYAVVYSSRCERSCAAAENRWKCSMRATVLDSEGYVLGDMEGDFLDVELRPEQSEIILLRSSSGDEARYAEAYDLHGSLKHKIENHPQH